MRRRITWGARLRLLLHARGRGHLAQMLWAWMLVFPAGYVRSTQLPSHDVTKLVLSPDEQTTLLALTGLGAVAVAITLLVGYRKVRLLRRGAVTTGTIVAEYVGRKTPTGDIRIFTFKYEVPGAGTQRVDITTDEADVLIDEPEKTLLYDPDRPSRATPLDHLPGAPELLPDGTIAARGGGEAAFILPALALVACVALLVKLAL